MLSSIPILNETHKLIEKAALACYPEEMCGILLNDGTFKQITNVNPNPLKAFTLSQIELVPYIGKIFAIIHTHVSGIIKNPLDPRTPSYEDILGQETSKIPWLIFSVDSVKMCPEPVQIPRVKHRNYLKRPFIFFIQDCYSLVQDYYYFELGIDLPNHKVKIDYNQTKVIRNIVEPYIEEYGFKKHQNISKIKNNDLILVSNGCFLNSHLGLFKDGRILHQDKVSQEVPFEHFIGRINGILSYEG